MTRKHLYALAACMVLAAIAVAMQHFSPGMSADALTFLTASVFIPVVPKSQDELNALSSPGNAKMQAFRAPFYDTQSFVSGTTTSLTFFGAINADKTLSNAKGNGGVFPNNMYFEPLFMNVDILQRASLAAASTQVGTLDDINQLVLLQRGIAIITVGQVRYPEIPISYLHASGGAFGGIGATLTAPNAVQFGTNGVQDSGYCIANSFYISPMLPFSVTLQWAATATLNGGNTNIRVSFDGNWHLPVS